jgi:hypothetical protein
VTLTIDTLVDEVKGVVIEGVTLVECFTIIEYREAQEFGLVVDLTVHHLLDGEWNRPVKLGRGKPSTPEKKRSDTGASFPT